MCDLAMALGASFIVSSTSLTKPKFRYKAKHSNPSMGPCLTTGGKPLGPTLLRVLPFLKQRHIPRRAELCIMTSGCNFYC